MLTAGPFTLLHVLGRGGMGEVWLGEHGHTGLPVAVKVLRAERARNPRFQAALRREVRAVAALDHPGVVQVLDQGELGAHLGGTDLVPGTPYLAMELADGPSLARALPFARWEQAATALAALLDALAHAHARNMLHRDIKPENLLGFQVAAGIRWKLADFGVAALLGQREAAQSVGLGTPAYMAPEQVGGEERLHGPWTDLYAVGCLAWQLVCGAPPFDGEPREVMRAHRQTPLPALRPRFPVPEALSDWLLPLLEKDPQDRPELAADVRAALLRLGPPTSDAVLDPGARGDDPTRSSTTFALTLLDAGEPPPPAEDTPTPPPSRRPARRVSPLPAAPFAELAHDPAYTDAQRWRWSPGLGLLHLRPLPLTGRDPERAALWRELSRVRAGGPRVVVLSGPAGAGCSRLLGWLCERAVEQGAARPVLVRCVENTPLLPPLSAALRTALGHLPPDVDMLADRLLPRVADADEARWLALLLAGEGSAHGTRELKAAWLRALRAVAADRPVVLALDDADLCPEAMDLAEHLAEHAQGVPVLVALTLRGDRPTRSPGLEERMARLQRLGRLTRLAVDPLPPETRRELLRRGLGLSMPLAARVDARSGGLPGLAVERVRRWAEEGRLEERPDGLVLVGDEGPEQDPTQAWLDLTRAVCGGDPPPALGLAAVLGPDVHAGEWAAACAFAGVQPTWELAERLLDRALAAPLQGRSWTFAQRPVQQAVLAFAQRAGLLATWCAAAAQAVGLSPNPDPLRLGLLLLQAQQPEQAWTWLREGARALTAGGDYMRGLWAVEQARAALVAAGVPPEDPRWGDTEALRGQLSAEGEGAMMTVDEARALLARGVELGWTACMPRLRATLAHTLRRSGQMVEAEAVQREAIAEARALGDPLGLAHALTFHCVLLKSVGRVEQARAEALELLALAERTASPFHEGWGAWTLGWLDRTQGRAEAARLHLERALSLARAHGFLIMQAGAAMELAELDREQGRLAQAEDGYRVAARLWGAGGYGEALLAELNLANLLIERKDYAQALEMLRPMLYSPRVNGHAYRMGVLHLLLAVSHAGMGHWAGFDQHFAVPERYLRESGYREQDFADTALRAADLAAEAGEVERACRALRLAADQLQALNNPAGAAAARARADGLRAGS